MAAPTVARPPRIAIYSGVYMRHDAISGSIRDKLRLLRRLRVDGAPPQVTVFTQGSDVEDGAVRRTGSIHDVAGSREFQAADLHIFEFGIRYDLFNAIFLVPHGARVLGVYHNVTPPHLADSERARRDQRESLVQKHNLFLADHVACVSEFNRLDLLDLGVEPERLSVLHLPPAISALPRAPASGARVRLLYVGRFVRAKGVLDLLTAFARLREYVEDVQLTLAGSPAFSAPEVMREIEAAAAGARGMLRLVVAPDDAELARLYARSDALVMPSYHEGYCLPVVEAMASGCYVVAYDAANLPHVLGGLGTLVPPGDVEALAGALEDYVRAVQASRRGGGELLLPGAGEAMPESRWRAAVAEHTSRHSREVFEDGLVELIARTCPMAAPLRGALAVDRRQAAAAGAHRAGTAA